MSVHNPLPPPSLTMSSLPSLTQGKRDRALFYCPTHLGLVFNKVALYLSQRYFSSLISSYPSLTIFLTRSVDASKSNLSQIFINISLLEICTQVWSGHKKFAFLDNFLYFIVFRRWQKQLNAFFIHPSFKLFGHVIFPINYYLQLSEKWYLL